MLGHLIRKEILDQLLSLRFQVLASLSGLVVLIALSIGCLDYGEAMQDYADAQEGSANRMRRLIKGEPTIIADSFYYGDLYNIGLLIHRPVNPHSFLVRGIEPFQGRTIKVLNDELWLNRSRVEDDPTLATYSGIDLSIVVQTVLGLVALLLTYDAISGEKETGTLRLVGSYPVARHQLLVAKIVGAFIPLAAAFLLPLLLGAAFLLTSSLANTEEVLLHRMLLIVASMLLYLLVCIVGGIFASALTRRSSISFVLLLGYWALMTAIVPRLCLLIANEVQPAPNVAEHRGKRRILHAETYDATWERHDEWARKYSEKQGDPWNTEEGRSAFYVELLELGKEGWGPMRVQLRNLQADFRNRYALWFGFGSTLARISPAFALHSATIRLAGTGIAAHERAIDAVGNYMIRYWDWLHGTFTRDQKRRQAGSLHGPYQWDIDDIPRFTYRLTWPASDLRHALTDIGVLAAWVLLFFTGAVVAFLRYDLR